MMSGKQIDIDDECWLISVLLLNDVMYCLIKTQ